MPISRCAPVWQHGASHAAGSWLRLPPGDAPELVAADEGVMPYLKTGHLAGMQT